MYLLKSVGYQAIARADLFTLPCDQQVLPACCAVNQHLGCLQSSSSFGRSSLAQCNELYSHLCLPGGHCIGVDACHEYLQNWPADFWQRLCSAAHCWKHAPHAAFRLSAASTLCQMPRQTVHSMQVLERYIARLDISDTQPWLLQHFIRGPEYASYSIVDGSSVVAHADNVAELSCLNYAHVGSPEVGPPCVDLIGHDLLHCV